MYNKTFVIPWTKYTSQTTNSHSNDEQDILETRQVLEQGFTYVIQQSKIIIVESENEYLLCYQIYWYHKFFLNIGYILYNILYVWLLEI